MRLEPVSALGGAFGAARTVNEFRSDGTLLRERADIGCVLLTAATSDMAMVASASRVTGLQLPVVPGATVQNVARMALWLSPRSWLIHCALEEELDLVTRLNEAFPDKVAHTVPFTDALCWFELSGKSALDLVTEGGFVSLERGGLPVGHAKRTLVSQIAAIVVRRSESEWLLAVERSRARYLVDWLGVDWLGG